MIIPYNIPNNPNNNVDNGYKFLSCFLVVHPCLTWVNSYQNSMIHMLRPWYTFVCNYIQVADISKYLRVFKNLVNATKKGIVALVESINHLQVLNKMTM